MTKKKDDSLTVIAIPDSHAQPDVENSRFDMLGRMIVDIFSKTDTRCAVVHIGDLFDLPSLSSYDVGKKSFEGRRFSRDLESGLDAQRRIYKQIEDHNRPRRGDSRLPEIDWHYCLGNHEDRLSRCIENDAAKLDGVISLDMLTEDQPIPWTVHDFLDPFFLDGIGFCHWWASGVMGRAVGGEAPAATILRKHMTSVVQGHQHVLDLAERTRGDGRKLTAAVIGCYFTHFERYAGPQVNRLWSPGIPILHCHGGEFDFEWWSYKRIERRYS